MRIFIPFNEARKIVLDSVSTLGKEYVQLSESHGRTLAENMVSESAIPPFDNSAMDGFAVRTSDIVDIPVVLRVIATIPAGKAPDVRLSPGECARIMTGAPIPDGADAIVPVEKSETMPSDHVRIHQRPVPGAHIRLEGEDIRQGDLVLRPGTIVTPPVSGMLATLGFVRVPVATRPRVAVISTGDEVVSPDKRPGPGQIRNSNAPALAAQVISAGGEDTFVLHARDDIADIRRVMLEATEADVFVLAGGVSMGEFDLVRKVLDEMGATWDFWKVKQRPGKPLLFGSFCGKPVLGLPGNPVSASMCFEIYCRPLIAKMLGRELFLRELVPASLSRPMKKVKGLYYFARGITAPRKRGEDLMVRDTGPQGSNLFSSVVRANCIIHLPEDLEDPDEGAEVQVEALTW